MPGAQARRPRVDPPGSAALPHVPLAIGSVLSRTLSMWVRGLPTFAAISLISFGPLLGAVLWFTAEARSPQAGRTFVLWTWGAASLLSSLLGALLVTGVVERLRSGTGGVTIGVSRGLRRLFPVVRVTLLTWIAAALSSLAVETLLRPVRAVARSRTVDDGLWIITLLAGWFVTAIYHVAVPVAVLEGSGARQSMERSAFLTRGNRLRILALAVLWFGSAFAAGVAASEHLATAPRLALLLWHGLTALVLAPLGAISAVIVHADLRRSREGTPVEELTDAFD